MYVKLLNVYLDICRMKCFLTVDYAQAAWFSKETLFLKLIIFFLRNNHILTKVIKKDQIFWKYVKNKSNAVRTLFLIFLTTVVI